MIIDLVLTGVCLGIALSNREDLSHCETPLFTWLIVQGGYYFCYFLVNFSTLLVAHYALNARALKGLLELLFVIILLNFEFAWLVYGNTFHYTEESKACR
jgi:hypothetical protein